MNDIGIIGVGYIGSLFLDELLDAGYDVTVFDLDAEQVQAATERGASAADSPADLAREVDAVVVALPGSPEVEATMEGEAGLLESLTAGQVVVDATTTLPETSVACERLCRDRDVQFVEAPITGGSPRPGHHVMVGGTETAHDAARGSSTRSVTTTSASATSATPPCSSSRSSCTMRASRPSTPRSSSSVATAASTRHRSTSSWNSASGTGTSPVSTNRRSGARRSRHLAQGRRLRPPGRPRKRHRTPARGRRPRGVQGDGPPGRRERGPRRGTHRVLAGTQRRREPRRAVVSPPTTRRDGWMEGCETIVCQTIARISGDRPVLADG